MSAVAGDIQSGAYAQAFALLNAETNGSRPEPAQLHRARGHVLYRWGREREAFDELIAAERLGLRDVGLLLDLGRTAMALGRGSNAIEWLSRAIELDPGNRQLLFELGTAFQMSGRLDDAVTTYGRVLAIDPHDVPSLGNIGVCCITRDDPKGAEQVFREVVALAPDDAKAWINLAVACFRQERVAEALQAVARAQALATDDDATRAALANVGIYLVNAGELDAAIRVYEEALPTNPSPNLHFAYALALLRAGRLVEGWRQYEFRWLKTPLSSPRANFDRPAWVGQDVHDKTVLMRAEHGLGDAVQFARYAPFIGRMGGKAIMQVPMDLAKLARGFHGVERVVGVDETCPEFDYYVDLMSLPHVFDTDLESIPANVPYLEPPAEFVGRWRERMRESDCRNVGLAWAGSPTNLDDRRRSMQSSQLSPLFELGDIRFWSLQRDEAERLCPENSLVRTSADIEDLSDRAALISQLDLVITVDTSVAHLAGALGKPVWILLSAVPDCRWLLDRDDSPWYPTATLFRQRHAGDWADVVQRVKAKLRDWVETRAPDADRRRIASKLPLVPSLQAIRSSRQVRGLSETIQARAGLLQYFPGDDSESRSLEWYGEWVQPLLESILQWIPATEVGIEIGAGIGVHTIPLARALGPGACFYAYEGRPIRRRVLAQNLAANGVASVTLMTNPLDGAPRDDKVRGASETIDDLQLDRSDWIKASAGCDLTAIISGARDTLWRLRPRLFLSLDESSPHLQVAELIKTFGYRCWQLVTPCFNRANLFGRADDIFDGASAVTLIAFPEEAVDSGPDRAGLSEL